MSAKPVNVLAVLDSAANASNDIFRLVGSQLQRDCAEARAAVAELIEAAEAARDTLQKLADMDRLPKNSAGLRLTTAALRRVRGEQA